MESTFTFVTTTDAPALSASGAKLMRAHITKTNFARRRRRIAVEAQQNVQRDQTPQKGPVATVRDMPGELRERHRSPSKERYRESARRPALLAWGSQSMATPISLPTVRPTDPDLSIQYLFHEFAPLIFPGGRGEARLPSEASWIQLLVSEPALLEATMAIGVRARPTFLQGGKPTRAEAHAANAVALVNHRIGSLPLRTAVSDSLLATVFTLAFAELYLDNEFAWGVHIDGLTKMVKLRQAQDDHSIPTWFSDLILYDGFSLSSPHQRRRYQQLLAALASGARRQVQIDASAVTDEMAGLRQALNLYHAYDMGPNFVAGEIEARISRLQDVARQLSTDQRPFLRALGHAVKVFLPLSWPCESVDVDVATLAVDLRRSLESSHRRLCSSVDLTSWQFLVGALGSEAGSGHQKWFLLRLRKLLSSSPFRTWENVLSMWQNAFMPDDRVLEQFKRLWEECIQGKERT